MKYLIYPDENLVRAFSRVYSERVENLTAIDIGGGSGRHTKLLYDFGFKVDYIDISKECTEVAKSFLSVCDQSKIDIKTADFDNDIIKGQYDAVVSWNTLYAYNKSYNTFERRLEKAIRLIKEGGHFFISLRADDDTLITRGEQSENGTITNIRSNVAGYIFLDKKQIVDYLEKFGLVVIYIEKFTHSYTFEWKKVNGNTAWREQEPDITDSFWVVCAIKDR